MPWVNISQGNIGIREFDRSPQNITIIVINLVGTLLYIILTLLYTFIIKKKMPIIGLMSIFFLMVSISAGGAYGATFLYYQSSLFNYLILFLTILLSLVEIILTSLLLLFDIFDEKIKNLNLSSQHYEYSNLAQENNNIYMGHSEKEDVEKDGVNTDDAFALKNKVNKMQEGLKKTTIEMITEINETGEFAGLAINDLPANDN
ncbi:hypothetical protein [Spiroplasma endosymbiont of Aspidapion aeneum]|uniref:hypothetical protein n=1 Tax=Spiroplasma endosymbiont of Aspidapion aeneum TaxID=3066276 RepID=UPI00313D8837